MALLEVFRRNSLGAAAFGTFGSFWLAAGVYSILQAQGVFFLTVSLFHPPSLHPSLPA